MKKKIFINMCLVALVAVIITSLLTVLVVFDDATKTMEHQTVSESKYISAAYDVMGDDFFANLSAGVNSRITHIASDGTVLYDNMADPTTMENHSSRPEIKAALSTGIGESTRLSSTINEQTYYYAVKLNDGTVVRIANTISTVYTALFSMVPWMIGIGILTLFAAAVLAVNQTKAIVNPLNKLNLNNPEENIIYDELAPLLSRMEKQQQQIKHQISILNAKQKEFVAITENMQEGLIIIDNHSDVLSINFAAIKLFGFSGDFQLNSSVFTLNRNIDFCDMVDNVLIGKPQRVNVKINGRYFEILANPVTSHSKVSGAVIVIMDITEREKREELRREFTANVSHELKTPLTSISGYAEIMKNGLVKPEDISSFAGKIYSEAQRLIALVQDIIKLSRLDESADNATKEDIDLLSLANSVKNRLSNVLEQSGVNMIVEGEPVILHGERAMLEEMIYNLCDNGIKYNKPQGELCVNIYSGDNKNVISISDTGIGIPPKDIDRVFERFYCVDKSRSKEKGGTGLGLSIVKHCVLLHGGEVKLDSKVGIGTTITITFP